MNPESMDLIFHALSHSHRRKLLDLIKQMPGCSVNDLCKYFEVSRISVMKHLDALVEAQLVISRKEGRTRQLFFNAAPIQMIYDRWTTEYSRFWVTQAVDLKYRLEAKLNEPDEISLSNSGSGQSKSSEEVRKSVRTPKKKTVRRKK